jgi:predicted PurR-regulated permease PerM
MTDTEAGAELTEREKRVKRLLAWASLLALVAVAVTGLDLMVKNQILKQAKESTDWIDRLRKEVRAYVPPEDEHGNPDQADNEFGRILPDDVGGVDSVRAGAPAEPVPDEGL